jgi:hypothetical protein
MMIQLSLRLGEGVTALAIYFHLSSNRISLLATNPSVRKAFARLLRHRGLTLEVILARPVNDPLEQEHGDTPPPPLGLGKYIENNSGRPSAMLTSLLECDNGCGKTR